MSSNTQPFCSFLPRDASFSLGDQNLVVQAFAEQDLAAIFAIEQRSHPYPWSLDNFRSSLHGHHCFGVLQGELWIAYAVVSLVVSEAELLLLVVDKPWQGKGVAKKLMQLLMTSACGRAEMMFLEVRASNKHAVALYESLGFNQIGVRPGYYPASTGRREDALLYACDLSFV